jgi:hypothetical protein
MLSQNRDEWAILTVQQQLPVAVFYQTLAKELNTRITVSHFR